MSLQKLIEKFRRDHDTEYMNMSAGDIDKLLRASEAMREALDDAIESINFSERELTKIGQDIFPDIETCCDCENGCDCIYPKGFLELYSHQYHCAGSVIGIEEKIKQADQICEDSK